jgi:hypothetical protein
MMVHSELFFNTSLFGHWHPFPCYSILLITSTIDFFFSFSSHTSCADDIQYRPRLNINIEYTRTVPS